jgi:hypothetical protein
VSDPDETQDVADARESKQLALTLALQLAGRIVSGLEANPEFTTAVMEESHALVGDLVRWDLKAQAFRSSGFVVVEGRPTWMGPQSVTPEVYERLMKNEAQGFQANLPWAWVQAALRDAENIESAPSFGQLP